MNTPTIKIVQIKSSDWEMMCTEVAYCAPEEACGLLAGRKEAGVHQVKLVIPTTNILHSPVRYRIDPVEQLKAFERIEAAGFDLVGIYHSHPQGPSHPSPTDLAEAYYPEAVYLIWSTYQDRWVCNGYKIWMEAYYPVPIVVESMT